MNKANLLRVADTIERHEIADDLGFNMSAYASTSNSDRSGHRCEKIACIAGHVVALFEKTSKRFLNCQGFFKNISIFERASLHLGLTFDMARDLFTGTVPGIELDEVTPAQAVATPRYAATHDVVDWYAANKVAELS